MTDDELIETGNYCEDLLKQGVFQFLVSRSSSSASST